MGSLNPAAAAASREWHHQLDPNARRRMVNHMLQILRRHRLPVEEARVFATKIEMGSYTQSANESNYFKNIAAVIRHVERRYQNHHYPGNNLAHSSASILTSQQQSQQPDNSTLVQASSLSSDDQSSTGDSQTSALHNTSGQSTIGQMHQIAIQSATQSGIRHNPLNNVEQPVNQQQQHPEPSMNQQSSVQQIERTQQSLNEPATRELSNLHPNQPNNVLNQHETQEFMSLQPQHQEYAAFHSEDNFCLYGQSSPLRIESSGDKDDDFWRSYPLLSPFSQPFTVSVNQDDNATMYVVVDSETQECEMNIDKSADIQPPPASDTQTNDEEDGCFDSTGLTAKEDPNSVFMTDMPTNLKKRKYDHLPCSSG